MGKSSTNMGTHVTTFDVKLVLSTFIVICLSILFNEVIMFNSDDDDDDASPVVIAGPGKAQAFAVYTY
jgi:hypothetical protein